MSLDIPFETEISYFFGIKDPYLIASIADLYFNIFSQTHEEMLATLNQVYQKIQTLVPWKFNAEKAAKLEQDIIYAFRDMASLESLICLYKQIYAVIFNQQEENFDKIAQLRAFLFFYKENIERTSPLTIQDKDFIISIARLSESYLQEFEEKAT